MLLNALFKVIPVLLLLLLGLFLGRAGFFSSATRQQLKNLIVDITLPAALFLAFSQVKLELGYLWIIGIIFGACWLVMILSRALLDLGSKTSDYFPYLMTGFEAGMLGYAIFGAVYGADQIYKFGVIDLGQVAFVFFILVPTLKKKTSEKQAFAQVFLTFIRTPVILAILAGILFNQTGLYQASSQSALYQSLHTALQQLASMTTPLVALVIGSEIRVDRTRITRPLRTSLLRLLVWVTAALLLNELVIDRLLGLDPIFQAAVLTMAILPPPFVIPLFVQNASTDDQAYIVNTLSLSTLITLFAYVVVTFAIPPG